MKNWLIGAVVVALVTTTMPSISEAKRLGGGKSSGMQRDMPARTAPDAPPPKPAAPTQAAPAQAGAPIAGAAPAAAAAKRSWMGPIAGLAAGLGIAALMSHLGLGEAFGNFLMLALLGVAAVFLIGFLMRRFGNKNRGSATPAFASANAGAASGSAWPARNDAQPLATERTAFSNAATQPVGTGGEARIDAAADTAAVADQPVVRSVPRALVPAAFDSEGFARTAKMIFIRLQAANDTADLDDLRRFTTPELFAAQRLDLQERGPSGQHTDVTKIDAEVLDVADEADRQIVSVRFRGELVEETGAKPTTVDEVWHLVKPNDDSRPWAIAGIEQGA
ncbi:MAG: 39S ribosomal protein L45 [Rubrivivax sp.]|nr:39S ribosomal protein L45 [Rubrivivax sp.]